MKNLLTNPFFIVLLLVLVSISILIYFANETEKKRIKAIKNFGKDAYELNVSAEANPYLGQSGSLWLHGWMEAKEEDERSQK